MKPAFDVVVIGASAGGIEAVSTVLRALPRDFPASVVVAMHFHTAGNRAAEMFARETDMPVRGIEHGDRLEPGTVYVPPPNAALEVEPDGTVSVVARRNARYPIDATLESAATSYRARALAVILTGMRNDGARGVSAVKAHGGTVIVQSEDSSLHPAMPKAAIDTGVVDIVLPLGDIGKTINAFITRGMLPATSKRVAALAWVFGGNGIQATRLRAVDWASTSVGPVEDWSPELQAIVRLVMTAGMSMGMMLGEDYTFVVNDAAAATLGRKPAEAVGRPYFQTWPEMKPQLGPVFEAVHRGETFFSEDALFEFDANGRIEEKYYTSAFLPITTSRGIEGVFGPGVESTDNVLAARRMRTLATLATVPRARDVNDAFGALLAALETNQLDVPFAVAYEIDSAHKQAKLKSTVHVDSGSAIAPYVVDMQSDRPPWPFREVFETGVPLLVSDLATRFDISNLGPGPDPTNEALVYPIAGSPPGGVLVVGLNPRRVLDAAYRDFLDLLASQITAGILEAQAFTMSRRRADALAEANRAKTELFSNVSHEFRTPLTLISGPLERALAQRAELPDTVVSDLDVAQRSAKRLQLLVGSLLDMAQLEAKRLVPRFEDVDLAELTRSIVALFAPVIETAGLSLVVDCPPLPAPVAVDPEMWAKVIVNLMSNALKFTRVGEVSVVLRSRPQHAELVVSDTGVGIDEADQPQIFDRFFRGGRAAPRSGEGSGIGLALARELVQLHHGRIRVRSEPGEGAAFTVWIPTFGRPSRLPAQPREAAADVVALAEGALAWAHTQPESHGIVGASQLEGLETIRAATSGSRVLVVDDNADMRAYIEQLFAEIGWHIDTAADGDDAFTRLRELRVDIVVADVMMPKSNGFELVRRMRADAEFRETPVVLVTARADESAAVDGLVAGANDYITKPFSPRELVARVGAQIELSRVRQRVDRTLRSVIDALPMGVGIFDQQGRVISANPEMRRFLPTGTIPSQDPARRQRWSLLTGEPDDDFPGARALRGERVVPGALMQYVDEHGKLISTQVSAVPLRRTEDSDGAAFVVIDDITEQTEMFGRYQALIAATSDAVYRMSPDWSEMRELRGAGFIGDTQQAERDWLEKYIAPEDRAEVLDAIAAAIRENRMFELKHRVRRVDGTLGWTVSRAVPILDPAGRIVEWFGTASDVTAQEGGVR